MASVFIVASCALLLQTVSKNIEINKKKCPLGLHRLAYCPLTYVECNVSEGRNPASSSTQYDLCLLLTSVKSRGDVLVAVVFVVCF